MIYYNSWDLQCKNPFGAVQTGTSVLFCITATDCGSAYLCTDTMGEFPMSPCGENRFSVSVTPQEAGLVFYHFKLISQAGIVVYCGKGKGGSGSFSQQPPAISYQLTVYPPRPALPDWYRKGIVYQIFPDRFSMGNGVRQTKPNSFLYGSWNDTPMYIKENGEIVRWDFFGGNLEGIRQKLPYLKALNVTVLYLNPVFESNSNHRYSIGDYEKIDPLLGTEEEFQLLVDEAKQQGIHILLDGVFNHTGADSKYFNRSGHYETVGAYQNKDSPYADWYRFRSYPEDYDCWWGVKDLPALNQNAESLRQYLLTGKDSVVKKWTRTGIGGWRIDVADELPDDFLKQLHKTVQEINPDSVILGEVWEDASNKIAYGTRKAYFTSPELDCVMNYPFRNALLSFFKKESTAQDLEILFTTQMENYPPEAFYGNLNLIGSHDVERILSMLKDIDCPHALSYLGALVRLQFAFPGVPCIYYGDEAGVEGGKDPDNRKPYPWGRENHEILRLFQEASHQRVQTPVYMEGKTAFLSGGNDVFGVTRYNDTQMAGVYINRSGLPVTFFCPQMEMEITVPPYGVCEERK